MSIKVMIAKITDPIFLTYELLIGNWKLVFPTMVGLIIALTVISQSGVLVESYRERIFEETVFKTHDDYSGDIIVDLYGNIFSDATSSGSTTQQLQWGMNAFTNFTLYEELVNKSIKDVNYEGYISESYWYSVPWVSLWLNSTDIFREPDEKGNEVMEWPISILTSSVPTFYNQLELILEKEGVGHQPENSSEVILVRPKETDPWTEKQFKNLTLNTKVNITIPSWILPEEEEQPNKTVTIVGIVSYERKSFPVFFTENELSATSPSDNSTALLWKYFTPDLYGYYFLTHPLLLQQKLGELIGNHSDLKWQGQVRGKIFLEKTRFDAFNTNNEILQLQHFLQALEQNFFAVTSFPNVHSPIHGLMKEFEATIFSLILILLLVSFPVVSIALYLVFYSFGLIRRQKQAQIGIIKTRGGSWPQILGILLGEMMISTIIAVLVGFLLSLFLSDFVMRSTDYLTFLGQTIPVKASLELLLGLIVIGIGMALLLNLVRIIRMSRQQIIETLVPTEVRDPLWKRYYLDILMFILGTAAWFILNTLVRPVSGGDTFQGTPDAYPRPNPNSNLISLLMLLIGLPAPFLIFFGMIMLIARFFPVLMKKLADLLWKVEGGVNAFAIRNIVRHKQAANRAVLLITLALSFSILASSLIFSLDETQHLKLYYQVGADVSLSTGPVLNETINTMLKQNVSHLSRISGVYSANYWSGDMIYRNYQFLFIDPATYAETAFTDPSFKLSSSLPTLISQLTDNTTLLLFDGNLKADISKPQIGENLSIQFKTPNKTEVLSFRIGGTFKLWPTFYPQPWHDTSTNYWIIGSLGMFNRLNKSSYLSNVRGTYLAKVESLTYIEETVETITNVTGKRPSSAALTYKEYKTSFERYFQLSILNSDLIISIAVVVIGVVMFAFFTYVDREKEIGVERALGMTRFQTAQSFLVEAATILIFGSVIGYLTGVFFVAMFLQITQVGQTIPPQVIIYPTKLFVSLIAGILIAAGIGSVLPAYFATRKDVSRILKVE
ncbi:MAG: ABC transporter permease [Candidatus Heimdallarchaeota archaeon]|nr:MAG: ABC transporter permease [Candidatus Heimdallarchaeota archaeon]